MADPTPEQKAATAGIFKNIVNLLEHGLFFGSNAGYVAEAIGYLKANIAHMEKPVEPSTLGPEGLKVVPESPEDAVARETLAAIKEHLEPKTVEIL